MLAIIVKLQPKYLYVMNTFLATFSQTNNTEIFSADINGNVPFIGKVLAGTSTGSIINGTMFQAENLVANTAYLCYNEQLEYKGKMITHCRVITQVNSGEIPALMSQLGVGRVVKKATE
tara:strand:+ start:422 stop:778 length:357 start_codon:yes stop_codon:yes gene_type:complete